MQIAVGNSIINCKVSGAPIRDAGLVVVFLHGWGRTMEDFDALVKRLADFGSEMSFLQIDLPGFGGSPLPREAGFSLEDYCDVLENFLDKLAVSRAVLVGHSFGARIGVRFGFSRPEKIGKLILISAAGIRQKSRRLKLLGAGRRLFRAAFSSLGLGRFRFVRRLVNLLGVVFGSQDYRATQGALRETFKKTISEDLRADAARLQMPTLIIWGRNDKITPLDDGRIYAGLIPDSRLEVLETGHFPFLEKPEESCRAIISFLKDA